MTDPIIATRNLRHAYGSHVALEDVDLVVPSGTIGLVGANGAGKTTLLKLLLGMLDPAAGEVEVYGHAVAEDTFAVRSRVGYMPEADCLPLDQTAASFVAYAAELGGIPHRAARQRASEVLTLVGLAEERFRHLKEFSTGMKQRTKMAQALVHDPDLVLLDEPTAGLDPDGREEMLGLIQRLHGFGMDVVVSSHVLGDIERVCDWVVALDAGTVLRSGPLEELGTSEAVYLEVFDDPAPLVARLRAGGARVVEDGLSLAVTADGDSYLAIRDALAATGVGLRSLGRRVTTLEDIYLAEQEDIRDR